MQDLNDLYYFVQVVDHGGFSPAARVLGEQKSKLSRRIQALEDRVGVRLINRSSRHFSVTDIGRAYYDRCRAMLVEADAADQIVAQVRSEPAGVIRVSCPVGLLNFHLGPLFAAFLKAYPAVQLHLESSNRRVDVVGEGFDIAIRVRFPPLEVSDLVMRQLDISTQCLVVRPDLIEGHKTPLSSPQDLRSLPSLSMASPNDKHMWHLEHADGQMQSIPHTPTLITEDMSVLREAALAGVGVVQLPTMMIWQDIEAGRLAHILPAWRPKAGIIHAVFPSRRGLLPSVRALLDFLTQECAAKRNRIRL
jgi:DNA-binding transcriptional LysR family regulator